MIKKQKKQPTWSDVKTRLTDFDRAGLLALVQGLYALNKDNRAFLHARFSLGDDALQPYKATIARWLYPDVSRNQDISVAKAKKAISDYKKAVGQAEGLVELAVLYCEQATAFCDDYGLQDEGYFDATSAHVLNRAKNHCPITGNPAAAILVAPECRPPHQP